MRLRLSGTTWEADAEPEMASGPEAGRVRAARDGSSVWVWFRGETYRLEHVVRRPGAKEQEVEHDLLAPMPGRVSRVLVNVGDPVKRGAALMVIEAMKMAHEIRAPKDGVVVRLHRKEGEMVGLGDLLAELE